MKRIFSLLLIATVLVSNAQKDETGADSPDKFRFIMAGSASAIFYKVMGPSNVNPRMTVRDQYSIPATPVYQYEEESFVFLDYSALIGLNMPFYTTDTWSTGLKSYLGLGQVLTFDYDMNSVILDLPQFLYFRHYGGNIDLSFLAGYRYTLSPISSGVFNIGIDWNATERAGLRFFITPFARTYWRKFSNGDLVPALKVRQIGLALFF